MVIGVIDLLVEFLKDVIPLTLPEILTKPLISSIYVEYLFLAFFVITIPLSRFIGFKRTFYMSVATLILGLMIGGIYFAAFSFILQLPLIFTINFIWKKKEEGEFGGGMEGLSEGGKTEFTESFGGSEMFEGGEAELPKTGSEELTGIEVEAKPKQKTCPYCHNPIRYIEQYKSYYCDYCKRYL